MQHFPMNIKSMRLAAIAFFAFACCSGCSIADALIDGVFLGVSNAVGTTISTALAG